MTSKAMLKKLGVIVIENRRSDPIGDKQKPQVFPPEVEKFYNNGLVEIEDCSGRDWYGYGFSANEYEYNRAKFKKIFGDHNYELYMYNGYYIYEWTGQGWLCTKTLIKYDDYKTLLQLKDDELAKARKKRFNTIKTPIDVLRLFFAEKGIAVDRICDGYRLRDGDRKCCKLAFLDNKNGIRIYVCDISGDHFTLLTTIDLADPKFEDKILSYIDRLSKIKDFILGGSELTKT